MAQPKGSIRGIAAIYRNDSLAHIIFGAIQMARKEGPERKMESIAQCVIETFQLENTSPAGLLKTYYRVEAAYLQNGGINE